MFAAEVDDLGIREVLQDRMQHPHSPIPLKLSVAGEAVPIRTGACPIAWRECPENLDLCRSDTLLGESSNHIGPEGIVSVGPIIQAVVRLDRVRQTQPRVDVRQMQGAVVEVLRGRVDIGVRIVLRARPDQVRQADADIGVDDLPVDRIGRAIGAQRHNAPCDRRACGRVMGVIGVAGRRKQSAIVAQVPVRTHIGQRGASGGADRAIRRGPQPRSGIGPVVATCKTAPD